MSTQPKTKMFTHTTVAHECERICSGYGAYPRNKRIPSTASRTHARVIKNLEYHKSKTYCTMQHENIDAAIAYYSQLPPDSPDYGSLMWFQNGKHVSRFSDLDLSALTFLETQLPTGKWIVQSIEPYNKKDIRAVRKEGIPDACFKAHLLDAMFPRTIDGKPASKYAGINYPHCRLCKCKIATKPEPSFNEKLISAESSTATLIPKSYEPSAIGPDMREKVGMSEKGMPEKTSKKSTSSNKCILARAGKRVAGAIVNFFEKRAPGIPVVIEKSRRKY
ncbi:hypothetical protein FQN50_003367 [Emmonsiellopsis sp. PD_5]|nr:hypothetical protein FQN50_003367 [Emmonsiellopsis sp. PD_5]